MQTYHIYYLMPEGKASIGTGTIKKINKEEYKIANKKVNKKENDKISCQIGEYTITAVGLDVSGLALETTRDKNKKQEERQSGGESRQAEKLPEGNTEGKVLRPDGIVRRKKKSSGGNSAGKKKRFSGKDGWLKKLLGRNFLSIQKLFVKSRVGEKMFRHFHLYDCVKGKDMVVVSEKLQKMLPRDMWYENMTADFPKEVHEAFAVESLVDIVNHAGAAKQIDETARTDFQKHTDSTNPQHQLWQQSVCNLVVILPRSGVTQELLEEILSCAGEMNELIFYSFDEDEKEWIEDKLDDFLEETGVAGMCYQMTDDRWENPFQKPGEIQNTKEPMILMDFTGRPIKELWGISYYIDAAGRRTKKEIRSLMGRKTHVKALCTYLDSSLSLRYNNLV